ncbi:hypothetical protein NKG94_11600 [Micromonospora sp. M12]
MVVHGRDQVRTEQTAQKVGGQAVVGDLTTDIGARVVATKPERWTSWSTTPAPTIPPRRGPTWTRTRGPTCTTSTCSAPSA